MNNVKEFDAHNEVIRDARLIPFLLQLPPQLVINILLSVEPLINLLISYYLKMEFENAALGRGQHFWVQGQTGSVWGSTVFQNFAVIVKPPKNNTPQFKGYDCFRTQNTLLTSCNLLF